MGLPIQERDVLPLVGKTAPQTIAALLTRYNPGWEHSRYDLDALAHEKNNFYLALAQDAKIIYPGVKEGIKWLRSLGIKTAVVSNAKKRELETVLKAVGLFDLFDVVISRDATGTFKPDPATYLFGAASVGVGVDECLAIEDSPPGIEAALMAGIPSAAVLTNFTREVMVSPVLGRPDLRPIWIGKSIAELFIALGK